MEWNSKRCFGCFSLFFIRFGRQGRINSKLTSYGRNDIIFIVFLFNFVHLILNLHCSSCFFLPSKISFEKKCKIKFRYKKYAKAFDSSD